ncbi:hypothetical protein [Hyphobacterium marinum]|uniref:Nucleoside 2-deoxyribosyltransferase n=1 Tax=Hyphobacterium marinum TaxID=3116574 RepID=A0ABU7M021_9PROT|nr:hypothetical protein [Hyphobacterium sp. Y6023]MEE2567141.1 hypothetical protein [Hyphobacterium sp. Y6023]
MQQAVGNLTAKSRAAGLEIFIATPMSAFDSRKYSENREKVIALVDAIRRKAPGAKIFCPALEIADSKKWDLSDEALEQDIAALERADLFILLYLSPLPPKPSSVLVEAGIALGKNIPSIYLINDRADLPYMLNNAESFSHSGQQITIVQDQSMDGLIASALTHLAEAQNVLL